ncbi:hypothetical protein C0Q70_00891 [Pomacea canaliculata]|uniref:Uncharacterized protein n=1 Tax=Pomacea canaliculata TaxID=400727 RepID=A0A2T7PY01_POMCA|nr:hypothetical protein C0Q70_00891 [Pomacea canaliculata]
MAVSSRSEHCRPRRYPLRDPSRGERLVPSLSLTSSASSCWEFPLFALELSFGQYGQKGPLSIWDVNPIARGIGFASITVSGILMIYYSVVIAWGLRFLIASLTDHLPWIDCKSCDCLMYSQNLTEAEKEVFRTNNSFGLDCSEIMMTLSLLIHLIRKEILWMSDGIDQGGTVQWELLLCNLACFAIVFGVLYKGIQSLGKVVYFTSLFPYVLLTILLVRVAMLDGAHEGVKYYLTPRWDSLSDASMLSRHVRCQESSSFNRDAIMVPIINCSTSFYAGFVVFSTLGYMANVKGTDVGSVTKGGPGLAFIVYPEAIAQMPVSPLWAIFFFIMLCMLGFSSQVVYFTSLFPYVLLTILLVRVAMLDGAHEGVKYYLTPRWDRLSDAGVWSDAAVQIFFSLSCCSGGLIAMASYNNFKNNVIRDAIMVPIINCLTSFYAGFVVFSTLGYMAHVKQTDVGSVTQGGPGLAFIVYPEAIGQMPVSPLWAILFLSCCACWGLALRIFVCAGAFVLGIPLVTQSGFYLLDLVDSALLGFPMLTVGLMEFMVLVVLYGYKNFAEDVRCMVGREPFLYFKACWMVIAPVLLTALIIFKAFQFTPQTPDWANLLYWLIVIFPIALIVLWGCHHICKNSKMTQATPAWFARRETGRKLEISIEVSNEMSPDMLENGKGDDTTAMTTHVNSYDDHSSIKTDHVYINNAFDSNIGLTKICSLALNRLYHSVLTSSCIVNKKDAVADNEDDRETRLQIYEVFKSAHAYYIIVAAFYIAGIPWGVLMERSPSSVSVPPGKSHQRCARPGPSNAGTSQSNIDQGPSSMAQGPSSMAQGPSSMAQGPSSMAQGPTVNGDAFASNTGPQMNSLNSFGSGSSGQQISNFGRVDELVRCTNSQPIRVISNRCWMMIRNVLTSFLQQQNVPCSFEDIYNQCSTKSADILPLASPDRAGDRQQSPSEHHANRHETRHAYGDDDVFRWGRHVRFLTSSAEAADRQQQRGTTTVLKLPQNRN